jgi:hypothetical protein
VSLFEDKNRSDREIRRSGENTFRFLDRVDDVYFGRVRDLVEDWFGHMAEAEQQSFRRRFATSDEGPGDPAFFELYLHEALRRAGFALTYEPAVPGSTRRPDYLATASGVSFYLEAKAVGESRDRTTSEKRQYAAIEPLRKIESRDFTLDLGIVREGKDAPPTRRLVPQVERWLAGLDRGEIQRLGAIGLHHVPRLVLTACDWEFSFQPIPKPEQRIGIPSPSGAISIFPGRTAGGSDWGRPGDALKEKARRYGDLGRPFVIALLPSAVFVDYEEIVSTIYGEPVFAMGDAGSGGIARPLVAPAGCGAMALIPASQPSWLPAT